MAGGRPFPNITTFLRNQTTSQPLFLSTTSAPPFLGSTSMMSFEGEGGCNGSFFRAFDIDDNGDDDYFHQPDKKRRLSANQVQFLEKSFEEDNKLEPERKTKLAKDLALQPRQVAIWFQNRRARWKTKQLEKDFDTLHRSYDTLKANYDILLKEKHMLTAEVASLSEKVLARGKQEGESEEKEAAERTSLESVSEGEGSKVSCVGKQEDISSAMSDILDSSSLLDHGDSSYAFEPDQSDDEDDLSKTVLYPSYLFPKLEDVDYSYPPENSCNFGFPEEDQALWTWAY